MNVRDHRGQIVTQFRRCRLERAALHLAPCPLKHGMLIRSSIDWDSSAAQRGRATATNAHSANDIEQTRADKESELTSVRDRNVPPPMA
jgi:hypothetical protein